MILKHTHQMMRVKGTVKDGRPFLFMCADSHCTYKEEKKFLLGKASLCNTCRKEMILTTEDLKRSKPMCRDCSNTKEAKEYRRLKEVIRELIPPEQVQEETNA